MTATRRRRPGSRRALLGLSTALAAACGTGAAGTATPPPPPAVAEPVTFNRHLAPLVHRHCAPCHRPGEAGPFSLLTYADVRKRGEQV
ncbi:MAG TPA: hypothetical protein VMR21_10645, partial [Vicinamibacteria bacterium]|nr:hypothetical protein [Vicinamibacteria bacterium]